MTGGYIFTLCVSPHPDEGGGSQVQVGGVPDPAMDGGGSQVSDFPGGVPGLRFSGGGGGSQVSDFLGGVVPGLNKGKNF